jgi:plasmid stabilization system protein ParE
MAEKIIYSEHAFADIDRIIEFNNLRNRSSTYSKKFIVGLKKRLQILSKQPLSGIKTDMQGRFLLVWDQYYIFYKLDENSIVISAIYHQKEDISR